MLHLLYGADDFSASAEADRLAVRAAGGDSASVARLDGASCTWSALRETCLTQPMFAVAQVVLVRGLLGAWSGRGESGGKPGGEESAKSGEKASNPKGAKGGGRPTPAEFAAFAGQLPETAQLILLEGELTPANRYLKELSALGHEVAGIRAFTPPSEGQRAAWIAKRVQSRGGSIDQSAAALLAERAGADLWALANEIEKLLAYTAPRHAIARPDVEALVQPKDDATGFKLVDAVSNKDLREVVDMTERLLAAGQAPEQVLALLGARIRDLSLLAAAAEEGVAPNTVGARMGWNPGRMGHLTKSRRQFSFAELVEARTLLVAADLALKSRPTHERPLVMLLTVLAIAQRRPSEELATALAY